MSQIPCVGRWDIVANPPTCLVSHLPMHFLTIMVNNINNFGVINFYESNSAKSHSESQQVEDVQPLSSSGAPDFSSEIPDSIIFTKKAHQEHKIPTIVKALQKSIIGRKDKTRALVQELQSWQKDNYIDPQYNAQVMYDELQKILPLPFGYEVFKKHYNNTRY